MAQMQRSLRKDPRLADAIGELACKGAGKEGHRRRFGPSRQQGQYHQRHQRALGIMQPALVLPVIGCAHGRHETAVAVGLYQVVDNGATLGQNQLAILQHRHLAQRVDAFQGIRCPQGFGITSVLVQFVGNAQQLQQPEDAQGAGLVEGVQGDHGSFSERGYGSRGPQGRPAYRIRRMHGAFRSGYGAEDIGNPLRQKIQQHPHPQRQMPSLAHIHRMNGLLVARIEGLQYRPPAARRPRRPSPERRPAVPAPGRLASGAAALLHHWPGRCPRWG